MCKAHRGRICKVHIPKTHACEKESSTELRVLGRLCLASPSPRGAARKDMAATRMPTI